MAEFKINIIEPPLTPLVYTAHTGAQTIERCPSATRLEYVVKMLSTDSREYGILETYSGDNWKYINITSINLSSNSDTCNCIELEYNNTLLENSDTPTLIDVEALSGINDIPLFKVAADNYDVLPENFTASVNVSFTIEDINGTIGDTLIASFQIKYIDCSTVTIETPVINSALTYSTVPAEPESYIFEYYITSLYPVTSYGASGLPAGATFNSETGFIRIDTLLYDERHTDVVLTFDISAINSGAIPTTDTKTFTLTIVPFRGYL